MSPTLPLEQPLYLLPQRKRRAIIPQTIILIILGVIFYMGILLNISLLELRGSQETSIKTISLIIICFIIIIGIILVVRRTAAPYRFYRNRIIHLNRSIYYSEITATNSTKNWLDGLFNTYCVKLSNQFTLHNISQSTQIQTYLQQMIQYAQQKPEPGFSQSSFQ